MPSPATAADKLMQLMTLQPQMQPVHAPVSSSFNFSYVEEGKHVPEQPPAPPTPHFASYPLPPQPTFHPMAPPIQALVNTTGLSDKEFPPLGGAVKQTANVEDPPVEEPKQAPQSPLVPSSALLNSGK
jgi:hypothetical protein